MSNYAKGLNFRPAGNGICVAVTTTSQAINYAALTQRDARDLIVTNAGSGIIGIAWGDASNVVATLPVPGTPGNAFPVLPGQTVGLGRVGSAYIAVVGTAASTVYINQGEGN